MKLKISSIHLICFILIEIILIDAALIIFFINKSGIKIYRQQNTEVMKVQSINIPKSKTKSTVNIPDDAKKSTVKVNLYRSSPVDYDIVGRLLKKLIINSLEPSDFKIPDGPYELEDFTATAYDLSYESCGKYPSHPEYGITYSGKRAVKGRTIAVDPGVIPLGSSVYIKFPKKYTYLDGWYVAEDIGSKVKGNMIDLYLGESALHEAREFGRRRVGVRIVDFGQNSKFKSVVK